MTNVRRPVHLPLQRPSLTMVSSSSGPSPFGVVAGESGSGASGNVSGVSPVAHILGSGPLSGGGAQQSPGQPAAPRAAPIRPNALINFNCITQAPSIPSNLASPMQQPMMMGSFSSAAASSSTLVSPRSSRSMNIGGPQRPTCCPTSRSGAAPGDHAIPALNYPCHNRHNYHQHYHHHTKALSPSGLNDSLPSQIMPHLFVGNQEQTNRETVNKLNIKYILSLGLLPMIIANGGSTSVTTLTSPISPTVAAINKKASSKSKNHHNHHHHHHHHLQQPQHLMPGPNSSRDFKIRIRSNTPTTPTTPSNNSTTSNLNTIVNTSTTTNTATQQAAIVSAAGPAETISPTATTATTTSTTNTTLIPPPPTKPRDENKGIKQVRSVYCKCINIADNSDQLLDKFFEEAYMFIDEARRKKCNILIHCLAGISRSPTIAIAYLMRVRSLHWKDAYDLVKQCRPQIDPNLNFMGQLRIYNKSLRDEHRPAAAIGGGTTGGSGKRNNNISSSGINDSPLISDDCHNATTIKQNCCIDNHNNGNGGNTTLVVVGHESTNVTANLRDKDNN